MECRFFLGGDSAFYNETTRLFVESRSINSHGHRKSLDKTDRIDDWRLEIPKNPLQISR